jgi:SAM-dependent methyltransferase
MRTVGVRRMVSFNRGRYAAGVAAVAAGAALPGPARPLARAGAALGATWLVTSVAATWCAYDRSPLYDWRWLTDLVPAPRQYAVLTAGLDEAGGALAAAWPSAWRDVLDLYDPARTPEPSIRRARALEPATAYPAEPGALPLDTACLDAAVAVFALHELRENADRAAVFAEIARILRPGGRLLLVEHCRDAANVLAYGPGAWHFQPRAEWLRQGRRAGLDLVAERTMTPLVRALVWAR